MFFDAAGIFVDAGYTNLSGTYTVTGLADGTYFAQTYNSAGYQNEAWNNIPCLGYCDPTIGTPIVVTGGATVPGIDFGLAIGGQVSGVVIDAVTSLPLVDVSVRVRDAGGATVAYGYTNTGGSYLTDAGVPSGTYFVQTYNNAGYVDELYDDVPCLSNCDVARWRGSRTSRSRS
jgi:hypothetical protein